MRGAKSAVAKNAVLVGAITLTGQITVEGRLTLGGSQHQTISGSGSLTAYELAIENASCVTASGPITVSGTLTLDGDLDANGGLALPGPGPAPWARMMFMERSP